MNAALADARRRSTTLVPVLREMPEDAANADAVARAAATLRDARAPTPARFSALFQLRALATPDAVDALVERLRASEERSALVRHECAFALGQMRARRAIDALMETLRDGDDDGMVRHECAEALGAIASDDGRCATALREAAGDARREVAETAALALRKLEMCGAGGARDTGSATGSAKERASRRRDDGGTMGRAEAGKTETTCLSVDPIPAMPTETPFERLKAVVLDDAHEMWERYAAMFALRNKSCADRESSDACADVLGEVLSASGSALLKHEVCYVLGQLQSASPGARDALIRCLEDSREHPMVRHEAAEALGSIAHPSTRGYLESFASDPEPIIAESCEVALEIMRREREGEIVTADGAVVAVKRD